MTATVTLSKEQVRFLWLKCQGLDRRNAFGKGPQAVPKIIQHLGYVQIDTINVIERAHHHILYSRQPHYKRSHLRQAQAQDKTVFEYWTHALAYVATEDFKFFMGDMLRRKQNPSEWYSSVTTEDIKGILRTIKNQGPLSIRDVDDEELEDKKHPWSSRKPSKKFLQCGFNGGELVISERQGMLKKYELVDRHFGWDKKPKAASSSEVADYRLCRALRSQGVVSLDSAAYMEKAERKKEILQKIEERVRQKTLLPVRVEGLEKIKFWMQPECLAELETSPEPLTHILSPFDPLVIQRKRFHMFFDYDHRLEAYVPKAKRKYGYFGLPVVIGDRAVAVLDLKTDRQNKELLIQQWTWLDQKSKAKNKKAIEQELDRFEKFQLKED